MNDTTLGAGGAPQTEPETIGSLVHLPITRRDFLKIAGIAGVGIGMLAPQLIATPVAEGAVPPMQGYGPNAKGMVIGDPSRCTGCRRCEIACTSFNDGKSQPTLSRIKIVRNLNYGPGGAQSNAARGAGVYGNLLIVQDTCRQCGHPVPCQLACPNGAIEIVAPVNARVINVDKCTGCQMCQVACPWGMTVFDAEKKKSSKCHLCNGDPECVKACPNSALRYVPWQDRTKDVPPRWVVPAYLSTPANVASTCNQCHK